MATNVLQQDSHQAQQHTLLIATTDPDQRTFLAAQLDADGHTVYEADSRQAAIAKLSAHAIDLMVLGRLHRPALEQQCLDHALQRLLIDAGHRKVADVRDGDAEAPPRRLLLCQWHGGVDPRVPYTGRRTSAD